MQNYNRFFNKGNGALLEDDDAKNNFQLGAIQYFGKVPTEEFNVLDGMKIVDQKSTDFCVACTVNYTVEQDYRGFDASIGGHFARCKKYLEQDYRSFGLPIKTGVKVAQKIGMYPEDRYPSFTRSRNFTANPANLPADYDEVAKRHKIQSYFEVGGYTGNQKFKNYITAAYNNKEPVITGIIWRGGFRVLNNGVLIPTQTGNKIGHCVSVVGQERINGEMMAVFINSYGMKFGDKGYFYLQKKYFSLIYRGYVAVAMPKETAKLFNKYANQIIKQENNPRCYLVQKDKIRYIKSENALNALGYSLKNIITIPEEELQSLPEGDNIGSFEELSIPMKELFTRETIKI